MARHLQILPVLLGTLLACSCGAPRSYYFLTPAGPAPIRAGTAIGIGPVVVADYLDRPNLVYQEGGNRLALADSHRWAGDLEDNIAAVLATNVGRRANTGDVRVYPWSHDGDLRHQVTVDVRQFHGTANGEAVIDVAWRVYSLPDRRQTVSRSWAATEPLAADGYDALAGALSRLLDRLSAEIAATL